MSVKHRELNDNYNHVSDRISCMPEPVLIFEVFTLLPEVFEPYLGTSILQKARQNGLIAVNIYNLRDWTTDKHHITDDIPYGGGGGMVMKPEPIFAAVEEVCGMPPRCPVILLTPQGRVFNQRIAYELAFGTALESGAEIPRSMKEDENPEKGAEGGSGNGEAGLAEADELPGPSGISDGLPDVQAPFARRPRRLALICGRYEGVDERVRQFLVTDELSIGDFVITGGELAALVVVDAVARWIPGVLGDPTGALDDSHGSGLLEYPHYTRPPEFRGRKAPEVLLSGDHGRIARWRREQALYRTWKRRPDLLEKADLSTADRKLLEKFERGERPE